MWQLLKAGFLWLLNVKLIHEGTEDPVCCELYADTCLWFQFSTISSQLEFIR